MSKVERIELVLTYNDEEMATANVLRSYSAIERQRYLWVHTYGLTKKKDWQIYLRVPSSMGEFTKRDKFNFKSQFKYITKKSNQNDKSETIADII